MLTLADQIKGYQVAARCAEADLRIEKEMRRRSRRTPQGEARPNSRSGQRDGSRAAHAAFCTDIDRRLLAAIIKLGRGTRAQIVTEANVTKTVGYARILHFVDTGKVRVVGYCKTAQIIGAVA